MNGEKAADLQWKEYKEYIGSNSLVQSVFAAGLMVGYKIYRLSIECHVIISADCLCLAQLTNSSQFCLIDH